MRTIEPVPTSIYDGREHLGDVVPKGGQYEATTDDGEALGRFNTAQAAGEAIVKHRRAAWGR